VLGPSIKGLRHAAKQGRLASGARFRIRRLDHQSLFTIVLTCTVIPAIWTASNWAFGAKLMPMTAACAALFFSCLVLIEQVVARDASRSGREFVPNVVPAVSAAPSASANALALTRMGSSAVDPAQAHFAPSAGEPEIESALPVATVRARGFRFFLAIGGALALAWLVGLLPALLVMMLLQARFEFGERLRIAIVLSVAMSVALWLVFDRIFSTPWPPSLLGDLVPQLRAMGGLV
jgi:hypothetical protein